MPFKNMHRLSLQCHNQCKVIMHDRENIPHPLPKHLLEPHEKSCCCGTTETVLVFTCDAIDILLSVLHQKKRYFESSSSCGSPIGSSQPSTSSRRASDTLRESQCTALKMSYSLGATILEAEGDVLGGLVVFAAEPARERHPMG